MVPLTTRHGGQKQASPQTGERKQEQHWRTEGRPAFGSHTNNKRAVCPHQQILVGTDEETLLGPKQPQDHQMGPEANNEAPGQARHKPKCKTGGTPTPAVGLCTRIANQSQKESTTEKSSALMPLEGGMAKVVALRSRTTAPGDTVDGETCLPSRGTPDSQDPAAHSKTHRERTQKPTRQGMERQGVV